MAPKHNLRDPDLIPRSKHGTEGDLAQVGTWSLVERERMDQRFAAAILAAGHATTMPSTHFGTRSPVANYQRE